MGAFAAVAQGTDEEPQLITLRYTPADAVGPGARPRRQGGHLRLRRHLASSPALKMSTMKSDMGGGAAVLEATAAIARLRPARPRHRRDRRDGEPAERPARGQAGRHRPRPLGHDDRDHQHGRRGPPRAVRLPHPRARAGRRAARRRRDADRRRSSSRSARRLRGPVRHRRRVVRDGAARRASAPASCCGGCRCTRSTPTRSRASWSDIVNAVEDRKASSDHRPPSSCTASSATSRGRTSTSPASAGTAAAPTRPRAARASRTRTLVEVARAVAETTPRGRRVGGAWQVARRKCSRSPVAVPKPHVGARRCSTGGSVASSSRRAARDALRRAARPAASCRSRRGSGGRRSAASSRRGAAMSLDGERLGEALEHPRAGRGEARRRRRRRAAR